MQAKITGWRIWALTRELAEGEQTQTTLARKYNVTQQSVSNFARDHAEEIAEVREKLQDAYHGLWIADKRARIAVYEEDADIITGLLDKVGEGARSNKEAAELLRARASALKSVAEEQGDLPVRMKIEGGKDPVRHVLEGVDTEDLA